MSFLFSCVQHKQRGHEHIYMDIISVQQEQRGCKHRSRHYNLGPLVTSPSVKPSTLDILIIITPLIRISMVDMSNVEPPVDAELPMNSSSNEEADDISIDDDAPTASSEQEESNTEANTANDDDAVYDALVASVERSNHEYFDKVIEQKEEQVVVIGDSGEVIIGKEFREGSYRNLLTNPDVPRERQKRLAMKMEYWRV